MTVLGLAAIRGFAETVHFLVDEGADVDVKDDDGQTALHFAASKGNEATVKLLLDKGANPDSRTMSSWTPLFYAAVEGQEAIVKLLLEQERVVLNSSTPEGWTPLSMASLKGHETIVRLLLEKGADFDSRDRFGLTPLFRAVEGGHEAVAKLLLDKGADANPKDKHGRKPTKVDANIYCEGCGTLISHRKAYFQCRICLNSKFHLCELCIDSGTMCLSPDHEMVRHPAENGNSDGAESIIGSTRAHNTGG
jgi:ankyrin repeat protein